MRYFDQNFRERNPKSSKSIIKPTIKKSTKSEIRNVSKSDLIRLDESLRKSKSEREKYKNGWKLVIKDSCEVYKERQKKNDSKSVSDNERDSSYSNENVQRKKTRRQRKKRSEVKSKQPPEKADKKPNSKPSTSSVSTVSTCQSYCKCSNNSKTS